MNEGKLDVVKKAKARVNTDIFEISELKQKQMDKFNLDDRDIYYCGQESLGKERVALTSQQECSTWVQSQKWQNDLGSSPRQTIQRHSNASLLPNPGNSAGKESACKAGDPCLIPQSGRSFGEGVGQ